MLCTTLGEKERMPRICILSIDVIAPERRVRVAQDCRSLGGRHAALDPDFLSLLEIICMPTNSCGSQRRLLSAAAAALWSGEHMVAQGDQTYPRYHETIARHTH